MTRMMLMIWFGLLTILPFSMILTFILTLVVCSQILNNPRPEGKLPVISLFGVDAAYYYFLCGSVILFVQFLLIIIGRLQFLLRSQFLIHRGILYSIHAPALVSNILLLSMAIIDVNSLSLVHVISAMGMFTFFAIYCLLHAIAIAYLFIKRTEAPEYSNILWPLWFFICLLSTLIFLGIWGATSQSIFQYIGLSIPFLYILGFVPQFWKQLQMKRRATNFS